MEYLKEKWYSRLDRMGNKEPIFVYFDSSEKGKEDILKYIENPTPYKRILIGPKDFSEYNSKKFHYIKKISPSTAIGAEKLTEFLRENNFQMHS